MNPPFHHVVTQFRSLVDNWLGYYRETLGVTKTPVVSSRVNNRPTLLSRSHTVSPRSVFSGGEGDTSRPTTRLTSSRPHSRSSTYPMSSRQTSCRGTWNQTSLEPMNHSRWLHWYCMVIEVMCVDNILGLLWRNHHLRITKVLCQWNSTLTNPWRK